MIVNWQCAYYRESLKAHPEEDLMKISYQLRIYETIISNGKILALLISDILQVAHYKFLKQIHHLQLQENF